MSYLPQFAIEIAVPYTENRSHSWILDQIPLEQRSSKDLYCFLTDFVVFLGFGLSRTRSLLLATNCCQRDLLPLIVLCYSLHNVLTRS